MLSTFRFIAYLLIYLIALPFTQFALDFPNKKQRDKMPPILAILISTIGLVAIAGFIYLLIIIFG